MPAQANTAENIHVKKALPICIRNFQERFDLKNAEIIDENVCQRELLPERIDTRSGAEIGGNTGKFRATIAHAQLLERRVHARLRPAVDDHTRSFVGKRGGNGKSDSRRRSCDDSQFSL